MGVGLGNLGPGDDAGDPIVRLVGLGHRWSDLQRAGDKVWAGARGN